MSYSIYLWHWPLVILVPYLSGGHLGRLDKVTIIAVTLVLAALTKRFVEDRYRRPAPGRSPWRLYRFAAAGMALVVFLGVAQLGEVGVRAQLAASATARNEAKLGPCLGAGAIALGAEKCPTSLTDQVVPDPVLAKSDKPDAYADDCWTNAPYSDRKICTYGHGKTQVALVGNSHAGHWLPALQPLAEKHGWTITTYLVSQCNLTDAPLSLPSSEMTQNCLDYGDWVMEQTKGDRYDLVITSERQSVPVKGETIASTLDPAIKGYTSYLNSWSDAGTNVLIIDDPPTPAHGMAAVPDCLAEHTDDPTSCAGTPESWKVLQPLRKAAEQIADPRITSVDMDRYFCTGGTCPAVIGSVVTRFDASHITASYAKTLAPYLERPVLDALNR